MSSINRISNPNKLVETKVNYFIDRMVHFVNYVGLSHHFEIFSPILLIEKLIFRLEQGGRFRPEYTDSDFSLPFFTQETFWERYRGFQKVQEAVIQYNQITGEGATSKKRMIATDPTFLQALKELLEHLNESFNKDLVSVIYATVQCPHELQDIIPDQKETHATLLTACADLLASEYLVRGYLKSEIFEIINNVFSRDERFPFPDDITTEDQKKEFLEKRELSNQLQGFANATTLQPQRGVIMIKVYGGNFPGEFQLRCEKVIFYGKEHPFVLKLKSKMSAEDAGSFFEEAEYLLATTSVEWYSNNSLLENVKSIVRKELSVLNIGLERVFNVDNTNNYLHLSIYGGFKGMAWSSRKYQNSFAESSLQRLSDNAYQILRKRKGPAVDWFLQYEPFFLNALVDKSMPQYWHYLETLLTPPGEDKSVKDSMAAILLSSEREMKKQRIVNTLQNAFLFFSRGYDFLDASSERRNAINKELETGIIPEEIRAVTYPFIAELVKDFDTDITTEELKKAEDYYYRIMLETYELRNFFIHRGVMSEKQRRKITYTLPLIVARVRSAFFKELITISNDKTFDQITKTLTKSV